MKSKRTLLIILVWFVIVLAFLFSNIFLKETNSDEIIIKQAHVFYILVFLFVSVGIVLSQKSSKNKFLKLRTESEIIREKNKKIEEAHKDITDSITYAKKLQDALLTPKEFIDEYFTEYFLFFKPKDQVSGDFYYVNKIGDRIICAVADCTGHGVPGGFLTIIGITYLHEIVRRNEMDNPGMALNVIRERIKRTFRTFGSENQNGFDIVLCAINTKTNILEYAGAFNPLWIIRNSELVEYKATRNPVALYPVEIEFENHVIQLEDNDLIYLFSDGFYDQFGGQKQKKFSKKRFRELILENHTLAFEEQEQIIEQAFYQWKGDTEQVDDVTVMGIKWQIS